MVISSTKIGNLKAEPKTWLITGVAGFIGSHLLEALLKLDQTVVGLDNFSTGFQRNLDEVSRSVRPDQWAKFKFIKGDITSIEACGEAMYWDSNSPVDHVLHQAALGSVPRSLADPISTNASNVTGFLNTLVAARDANVKSFTYAASSSTYGDHPDLPKVENKIGSPLSPYAVTKYVNELYAHVFARAYGFKCIGLRYFNVFGPRQNPNGAYAAVIPKWIENFLNNEPVQINGDGTTSRDFCFVGNAVQANILAALPNSDEAIDQIYNVAVGERTSLCALAAYLREELSVLGCQSKSEVVHQDFRAGDVQHSLADITKARSLLNYSPEYAVLDGIKLTVPWYVSNFGRRNNANA